MTSKLKTVLFDLDGTLADTAPDLARVLNELLVEDGRAPLPFAIIRPQVSHGSPGLLKLGFDITPESADYPRLRTRLLKLYADNVCRDTTLFTGMEAVLDGLVARGLNWGIVTNKPAAFTDKLVRELRLRHPPASVISGDTTQNRKPHPEPMWLACRQAGSEPAQCVYVGDAERDIHAGRAAGMHTLVALFGYIDAEQDEPDSWGADALLHAPGEILDWLDAHTQAN